MRHATFLRWALIESVFACLVISGMVLYADSVHSAGKIAVAAVLAVFALASGYAGLLAWREDSHLRGVDLGIRVLPMLALLGTASGFLIAFSGSTSDVQQRVAGASTGLAATIAGIACTIVLMLQREIIDKPCSCGR